SSNTTSSSPISVSCSLIVGEKRVDYRNALNQAIGAVRQRSTSAQNSSLKTFTNVTISTITARAMEITQDVINLQGMERKRY
ncbi:unnamed protein product, partial [Rotaria magnacalcarata]